MVSRAIRHLLATLGGFVAIGLLPNAAFPQSPSERVKDRISEDIGAAVATDGPQSPALIEPLTELGEIYEADGEYALAAAALEQARHVVRANYGLYTLDQAPLMEQALENQQALGNLAMVQALDEELYDLANRHPADVRTAAIHRGIGERKMNVLRRFDADEYPPEIYGESGLFAVLRQQVRTDLVSEAQIHYADAAAVLLRNGFYSSDQLRDLEMEIARASDLFRHLNRPDTRSVVVGMGKMDFQGDSLGGARLYGVGARERGPTWPVTATEELQTRTNALWDLAGTESSQEAKHRRVRVDNMTNRYLLGRESLRRLIAYSDAAPAGTAIDGTTLLRRLEAYLHLADWDLLYSANGVALDAYEQVHGMIEASDIAEPLMAELFAPPIPVVLPTFRPNPLATPLSARYIDVAFEVTRYGESRRIEIVGASPSVPDAARAELVNVIKTSRFRPRATDGDLARASPVAIRYYLND